jgi:predicted HTH transcriptional regulator
MNGPFILRYIAEGEHQQQDFKMRIDDAKKIARTVSAFANTNGGRLLIGVKDNGSIAGIRPEEEMHMMEAAAQMYCKPPVGLEVQTWKVDNRAVLEINILPSRQRPHLAQLEDGSWKAFVRRDDENFIAPAVLLEVWKSDDVDRPNKYFHTEKEKKIFVSLQESVGLSQNQLAKKTGINRMVLTKLLARLVRWNLLDIFFVQNQVMFKLKDENQ